MSERSQLTLLDMIGMVAAGIALLGAVATFLVIPTFTHMFRDFGVALPALTVLVIERWPILLAVLVSTGLLVVGGVGPGMPSLVARRLLVLGGFCVASLAVLLAVVAFYLPAFQMSAMIEAEPGLEVELPGSTSSPEISPSLVVTIAKDGSLYLDATPVDRESLREALRARARERSDVQVVIDVDAECRHGTVVEVMDLARSAGVSQIAIKTGATPEPEPEPEPE